MFEALSHSFAAGFIAAIPYQKLILETIHIVAGMLGIGAITVLAVRLLGFAKNVSIDDLGRTAFKLAWLGFAILFISGLLQFIPIAGDAPDAGPARNPIGLAYRWWFQLKMGAVLLALVNLVWLHRNVRRYAHAWDTAGAVPAAVRYAALLLLVLLPGIFVFARMMFAFLQATGVNSR
jgi:hypothetical protein